MTSYWRSIVTTALSSVVSEIFNVEKCRDLEIGVIGHSRSSKVAPFCRSCMVSYWVSAQGSEETRMMGLRDDQKSFKISLAVFIQYRRVTDRHPANHLLS